MLNALGNIANAARLSSAVEKWTFATDAAIAAFYFDNYLLDTHNYVFAYERRIVVLSQENMKQAAVANAPNKSQ